MTERVRILCDSIMSTPLADLMSVVTETLAYISKCCAYLKPIHGGKHHKHSGVTEGIVANVHLSEIQIICFHIEDDLEVYGTIQDVRIPMAVPYTMPGYCRRSFRYLLKAMFLEINSLNCFDRHTYLGQCFAAGQVLHRGHVC